MCNCEIEITKSVVFKFIETGIMRRATLRKPSLRLSFFGTSKRKEIPIQANFCQYCGEKLTDNDEDDKPDTDKLFLTHLLHHKLRLHHTLLMEN
ncbi:MAG: hypothetical protein KGZ97_12095 [Bacteroidetes bacterium]|nr:hypothetical protein [Bacteroidota bacterium]